MWASFVILVGLLTPQAATERDPLTAWRYAQSIGKPLLIIVVPDETKRRRRWAQALSVMLNAEGDTLLAALNRHHVIAADRILLRRIGVEANTLAIRFQTTPGIDKPSAAQHFQHPLPDVYRAAVQPSVETWMDDIYRAAKGTDALEERRALDAVRPLGLAFERFLKQPTVPASDAPNQQLRDGFPGARWFVDKGGCTCSQLAKKSGAVYCGMRARQPAVLHRMLALRFAWQR